ncbi:carboxylate-amine ligase [Actinokineospora sp. G85]|uniref:carboxylate-amine ligase n=1 Tax=Actinokineospora sp. G85 TaxID=3406626 RepID=UPI003C73DD53
MSGETMGVEEEFLLVAASSGATAAVAEEVFDRASGAELPVGASIQRELRDTQIEAATGVCSTSADLREQLLAGRRALAGAGRPDDVLVVPSGTPAVAAEVEPGAPATKRFAVIDGLFAGVTRDYEACGLHVHVGVADPDTAVAVINHLARWLPTLLALSANSPFHQGRDTGYASWRNVQQARFPGFGLPPHVSDFDQFRAENARLVDCGALADVNQTFWFARPSNKWPTVEIRIADTAATVDDAILQALVTRALVRTALADLALGREAPPLPAQVASAAVWSAARYGLDGPGVDLDQGKQVPATRLLADLVEHVRDALVDAGDRDEVEGLLRAVHTRGAGASRQRQLAAAGGLPGVMRALSLDPEG